MEQKLKTQYEKKQKGLLKAHELRFAAYDKQEPLFANDLLLRNSTATSSENAFAKRDSFLALKVDPERKEKISAKLAPKASALKTEIKDTAPPGRGQPSEASSFMKSRQGLIAGLFTPKSKP